MLYEDLTWDWLVSNHTYVVSFFGTEPRHSIQVKLLLSEYVANLMDEVRGDELLQVDLTLPVSLSAAADSLHSDGRVLPELGDGGGLELGRALFEDTTILFDAMRKGSDHDAEAS